MWHDFTTRNMFRPPDWRWRRAAMAVTGDLPLSRSKDDAWSRRAIAFRDRLERFEGPAALGELFDRDPDLFDAHRLYQHREDGTHLSAARAMAHSVEARILAGMDDAVIAKRIGAVPGAIAAYRWAFYDVESRLESTTYITEMLVGPVIHAGLRDSDFTTMWKFMAYAGGPIVADWVISTFNELPRPQTPDEARTWAGTMISDTIQRKAMQAVYAARTGDPVVFTAVLDAWRKLVDSERSMSGSAGGAAMSFVMDSMQAMLGSMGMSVGGRAPDAMSGRARMPALAAGAPRPAADYRGDELVAMSMGATVVADLDAFVFPSATPALPAPGGSPA